MNRTIIFVVLGILLFIGLIYYAYRSQPTFTPPDNTSGEQGPRATSTPRTPTATTSRPIMATTTPFQLEGNLIRNNPGLTPDTWYIAYDRPGEPGITTQLDFGAVPTNNLVEGQRVRITGTSDGNKILVRNIVSLEQK